MTSAPRSGSRMSHEVSYTSDTEAEVTVRLNAQEVRKQVDTELRGLAKRAQMPGFRPGKVPRSILLKKYGQAVELDARQKLIEKEFQAAVQSSQLRPVAPPSVDPDKMIFIADTPERPDVSASCLSAVLPTYRLQFVR